MYTRDEVPYLAKLWRKVPLAAWEQVAASPHTPFSPPCLHLSASVASPPDLPLRSRSTQDGAGARLLKCVLNENKLRNPNEELHLW